MWHHFSFLFLFLFVALFVVSVNYHHTNEVFNSLSHDHFYHVTRVDLVSEEVYFDRTALNEVVMTHFADNLKIKEYTVTIIFYKEGVEANPGELSRNLTINLVAKLGYFRYFDKTFAYYLT